MYETSQVTETSKTNKKSVNRNRLAGALDFGGIIFEL